MNTILLLIGLTLTQTTGDNISLVPLPPIEATLAAANTDKSQKNLSRHSLVDTLEKQNELDFKEQLKKAERLPVPNVQNNLPTQKERDEIEARAIRNLKEKTVRRPARVASTASFDRFSNRIDRQSRPERDR